MPPENQAFMLGKTYYNEGKSLTDNPYNPEGELSSHWIEGYQMAAYEERQSSTSMANH